MQSYQTPENLLREKGMKVTPQRLLIVREIQDAGHIDVDSLYGKIREVFPSLSLATIYKNINALMDEGLLREVKIDGMKNLYELVTKDHIHFVCSKCGEVSDIGIDELEVSSFFRKISGKNVKDYVITIFGEDCDKCSSVN